jgi:hypothetical protein
MWLSMRHFAALAQTIGQSTSYSPVTSAAIAIRKKTLSGSLPISPKTN